MNCTLDLNCVLENTDRNALVDLDDICGVMNPRLVRSNAKIRIWETKNAFNIDYLDNPAHLTRDELSQHEDFMGENHTTYLERYRQIQQKTGDVKLLIRLLEGSDPLKPIRIANPNFSKLSTVNLCGVDSTLATIDQFDDVLSIVSAAAHVLNKNSNTVASRTDLYALNPRIINKKIVRKAQVVETREELSRNIGKSMRESEYALALKCGRGNVVIMDGTIFGSDKVLVNSLVAAGIIFGSVVKNPVSKMVSQWYPDKFTQYGYEKVGVDAVAYNDMLPPGTRSPFVFAQMISKPISWASKIFTYIKPDIPGTTVLRVEIPTDYAYCAEKLVDLINCACLASGDPTNCTAIPIVHAEYVAKAMLPNPYDIANKLKATLTMEAMSMRMQGSFNERRSMPMGIWS